MTTFQKTVKYIALGFAICLSVFIISTIAHVAIEIITGFADADEKAVSDTFTFEDVDSLDIEFGAGNLKIKSFGDEFKVEVNEMVGFSHKVEHGKLFIESGMGSVFDTGDAYIEITVPKDFILEDLNIELGAGNATLTDLSINKMDAEIGAGKLQGNGLSIEKTTIEVGAGKATLEYAGSLSDYSIELEKGVGKASVDGENYDADTHINKSAKNKIEGEVGVGKISLDFE